MKHAVFKKIKMFILLYCFTEMEMGKDTPDGMA